jgi:mono/diheme cytochrome c family protein
MSRIWPDTRSLCRGLGAAVILVAGGTAFDYWTASAAGLESSSLFSEAQATRGSEVSGAHCAVCHGAGLTGGGGSPPLQGPDFLFGWSPKSTGDLVAYISEKMPPGQGRSLTEQQYIDVSAYILSANGFPAGSSSLHPALPKPIGEPPATAQ